MIETLVTYIPFTRIHELDLYFSKNREILAPKRAIAYVDVKHDWQKEVTKSRAPDWLEIRFGDWGDGSTCISDVFLDLKKETTNVIIVDSDNILDQNFQDTDNQMVEAGFDYYAVMEVDSPKALVYTKRSPKILSLKDGTEVRGYKIPGLWSGPVFVGPKQALRFGKATLDKLNTDVIKDASNAMKQVDPNLRRFVSDETPIGAILYYSGIKVSPWIIKSTHYQRFVPSPEPSGYRILNAAACSSYGKKMKCAKYRRFYWYYFRYKIALLIRAILR